jgi:hypothetical protein
MVLRESLALACLGVVTGAAGAYASGRLVAGMLFGVSPTDPLRFGTLAIALMAIAAPASLLPALRASRIDPLVALKAEQKPSHKHRPTAHHDGREDHEVSFETFARGLRLRDGL